MRFLSEPLQLEVNAHHFDVPLGNLLLWMNDYDYDYLSIGCRVSAYSRTQLRAGDRWRRALRMFPKIRDDRCRWHDGGWRSRIDSWDTCMHVRSHAYRYLYALMLRGSGVGVLFIWRPKKLNEMMGWCRAGAVAWSRSFRTSLKAPCRRLILSACRNTSATHPPKNKIKNTLRQLGSHQHCQCVPLPTAYIPDQ